MSDSSALNLERRRFVRAGIDQPALVCLSERNLDGRCLSLSVGGALIKFAGIPVLPRGVMLRLSLACWSPTGNPLGNPVAPTIGARVVEVFGSRARVAFDPLPKALHQAISVEVLSALRARPRGQSALLS